HKERLLLALHLFGEPEGIRVAVLVFPVAGEFGQNTGTDENHFVAEEFVWNGRRIQRLMVTFPGKEIRSTVVVHPTRSAFLALVFGDFSAAKCSDNPAQRRNRRIPSRRVLPH